MSYKTLDEHILQLQKLQQAGHGCCKMIARHTASGACFSISNPHISNRVDENTGPDDLEPGEYYVNVNIGH